MAPSEVDLSPFSCKLGTNPEVTLHGADIGPDLAGVRIAADAREVPEVVLILSARGAQNAVFEGLAHVVVGDQPDPGPAAAAFLDAIDAGELEQAALNRPDLDNEPQALTRAMLRQLAEWARGGDPT